MTSREAQITATAQVSMPTALGTSAGASLGESKMACGTRKIFPSKQDHREMPLDQLLKTHLACWKSHFSGRRSCGNMSPRDRIRNMVCPVMGMGRQLRGRALNNLDRIVHSVRPFSRELSRNSTPKTSATVPRPTFGLALGCGFARSLALRHYPSGLLGAGVSI